ncbi:glycoside hydrolase family 38 C-terminal domain-containing protein [Lactobacillus sp. ESL0701]|uniref:glycoside hydrolase family 38 N-terminal domain-containing protein n=1 Tax=Lactobacillus sp. ESL0701 TaxID=2983217 RepID=UPI0023F7483D|nr:glycoside hydrolase family 38 C-terminal domain-containing protein [Lactobacillus sp. ESL0701]MDF7672502.1 glycoside hydrolase family 38 C-terminal domain-containing protein [Lactobacillus sp. ESL0701]
MVKAYLVNHTHWDREWYFSIMDEQVLGEQLFTEVLDELEKNHEANFCLDGQVSIVDEYVAIHPEAKQRINKLVDEGRLFVGPWYTQTDALMPQAESIIRNLVIGIKDTQKNYGRPMMVGYLPDSFGFNAQMPTLLHQVGIDSFVFWRGTNFKRQTNSVYFRWRGLSGKEVIALNFPFGYFTGQITPEAKKKLNEFVTQRYDPAVKFEAEHGNHEDVLVPSGIDQMNIVKNMAQTVLALNAKSNYHTKISSYPEFVALMRKKKAALPDYQGELRLPTYSRVHRSIGSVRSKFKRANFKLEQKLLTRVEPLCVIGKKVGINIGNGLLEKAWQKLLKCQPHDSLGGSVSESAAKDIWHRYKEVNELTDGIENMIKKKIAQYLKLTAYQVLIFNTDPHRFSGYKEIEIVVPTKNIQLEGMVDNEIISEKYIAPRKHILMQTPHGEDYTDEPGYYKLKIKGRVDLPGLGYKVIKIHNTDKALAEITSSQIKSSGEISFKKQKLQFVNGQINLLTPKKKYMNIISLVDQPNDGDTYDFSPYRDFTEQRLPLENVAIRHSLHHDVMIIRGSASLPLNLNDYDVDKPHYGKLDYILNFTFNNLGQICAKLVLNNHVNSHRLRLRFNPLINTQEVRAQIQAGYITTTNHKIAKDWNKEFVEKPVNLYNFTKSVTLRENGRHFTFWGAGQKEYEYRNNQLFITLMATTGELGKPNLTWRPGRASGDTTSQGHIMMPTLSAQELGRNEFEFCFGLFDTDFNESQNNQLTASWLAANISYQAQTLNMFINRLDNKIWSTENNPQIDDQLELINLPEKIRVAAIYPALSEERSYVIRLENLTNRPISIPEVLLKKGKIVNALENAIDERKIGPYDLISVILPLE